MPGSDTPSQASVATQASGNPVLKWRDFEDGMVGLAHHSVKHPVVTALSSVVSQIAPRSRIQRDLDGLDTNYGRYRPFIVTRKPRGFGHAPQIVLVTHFSHTPIAQLDACSRLLAVALGTVTPPHPLPTSTRIQIEPEWTEENSYAIAYPIDLKPRRHPTRMAAPSGAFYTVNLAELDRLKDVCTDRALELATLPEAALAVIQDSYETHRPPPTASRRGTQATQSRVTLASIAENEPATPTAPAPQKATAEVDEDGFRKVLPKRRSSKRGNTRGG